MLLSQITFGDAFAELKKICLLLKAVPIELCFG